MIAETFRASSGDINILLPIEYHCRLKQRRSNNDTEMNEHFSPALVAVSRVIGCSLKSSVMQSRYIRREMWHLGLIFLLALRAASFGLQESTSDSVCERTVSYTKTNYETYMQTYRRTWGPFYQTMTRMNFRVVPYTAKHTIKTCCEDFVEENGVCVPTCDPPCGQGTCVRSIHINICMCYLGYTHHRVPADEVVCQPICSEDCGHGTCTAPSVCSCEPGYTFTNNTCEPKCSINCEAFDEHSYCKEPEKCECRLGYKWSPGKNHTTDSGLVTPLWNTCEPICDIPCTNGICTAPDVCTCNEGYTKSYFDSYTCLPVCKGGCIYGKCIAPNECSCDEGFVKTSSQACAPSCSKDCVAGTCIAPEICSCLEGYSLKNGSWYECEPICEKTCVNGTCTTPGQCTCHEGFHFDSDESHICKPVCAPPCEPYGSCTAPNTCTCFDGFRLVDRAADRNTSIYFEDNSVCEPICSEECVNGYCSAPGVCTCNPGFRFLKGSTSNCEPTCDQRCFGGYCSEPHKCKCNPGYRPVAGNRNICTPICSQACINGFCIRPDTCSCKVGYKPANTSSNDICKPICKHCEDSMMCIAPGHCACKPSYRQLNYSNSTIACQPICKHCENGTCTAPAVCTCHEGYANDKFGDCKPICTSCENGNCVGPEICQCDKGFILQFDNETNTSSCKPFCPDCSHVECVSSSDCVCHEGYVKSIKAEDALNGTTCVKMCKDDCNFHGSCVDVDICDCFHGWRGEHCNESVFCRMEFGEGNRITSTTLQSGNASIIEVLNAAPLCPTECGRNISNTTECTKVENTNATHQYSIACLIEKDSECRMSYDSPMTSSRIARTGGIAVGSILIILLIVAGVVVILRKRRSGGLSLGGIPSRSTERRPTLLPDENDDTNEDL